MQTRANFLKAIADEPDGDAARLVFSDWLEENGEPERAELIRVQCELARQGTDHPRFAALARRQRELIAANAEGWYGPLWDWARRGSHDDDLAHGNMFQRGLARQRLAHTEFVTRKYHRIATEWYPRVGVGHLSLFTHQTGRKKPSQPEKLLESPLLAGLSSLSLSGVRLNVDGTERLAKCPHLAHLRELDLADAAANDRALEQLAASPYLAKLKSLCLAEQGFTPKGLRAVLESPNLPALEELSVREVSLLNTAARVQALAGSEGLRRLRVLRLELVCGFNTHDTFPVWFGGPHLTGLTELSLSGCYLRRPDCEALVRAPGLPNLRRLSVPHNFLDPEGARMLLDQSAFPALTELDLCYQHRFEGDTTTDAQLGESLAGLPALARLRGLKVGPRDSAGIAALASSPHLGSLRRLNLADVRADGARALAGSSAFPSLRSLTFHCYSASGGAFTESWARSLVESPHFPQLVHVHFDGPEPTRKVRDVLVRGFGERAFVEFE